jgi:hypothetical protein
MEYSIALISGPILFGVATILACWAFNKGSFIWRLAELILSVLFAVAYWVCAAFSLHPGTGTLLLETPALKAEIAKAVLGNDTVLIDPLSVPLIFLPHLLALILVACLRNYERTPQLDENDGVRLERCRKFAQTLLQACNNHPDHVIENLTPQGVLDILHDESTNEAGGQALFEFLANVPAFHIQHASQGLYHYAMLKQLDLLCAHTKAGIERGAIKLT